MEAMYERPREVQLLRVRGTFHAFFIYAHENYATVEIHPKR